MSHTPEELEAAREAAQAAVDTATSWDYSAGDAKIDSKLREGLDAAGVTIDDDEFVRIVREIDALTGDEDAGTPQVSAARPTTGA
ncbi:hypothetical protein [Dermacoccus barathri]|jgi:hypothetical protein|uniref:hypothetical protein n=1 Tax=Dermacoccus barathri TaxID=322601 RepID=UPI0018790F7E|nr:hypothetical protein [Dermacoccus barathri]MBE7370613.1 hypothetical protein [Dermacoccus barathri]